MSDDDWKNSLNAGIDAFGKDMPTPQEAPPVKQGFQGPAFPQVPVAPAAAQQAQTPLQPKPAEEPTRSIAPTGSGSLLDRLKRQAEGKLASDAIDQNQVEARTKAVGDALSQIYAYLSELCQQLNVLRQSWPHPMPVAESLAFPGLQWTWGRSDYRRRVGPTENQPLERVSLRFKLTNPKVIEIERENPAMDNLRKILVAQAIPHVLDETRNFKGYAEKGKFRITPEINAGMLFIANYDTGDLVLKVLNLPRVGSSEYLVPVSQLSPAILEEIALLAVGESSKFFMHFKRVA